MPRAKERTPELKGHVLGVAVDLLARDGVGGFTTRSLAREADTSTPAIYELFGDKEGLVRAVFFEAWRRLRAALGELEDVGDPRADLLAMVAAYRRFVLDNRVLAEVMLSRPFADFAPAPEDGAASGTVRELIVVRVQRAMDAGVLAGDVADVSHALISLVQGLAAAETAGRLGSTQASVDRRWEVATGALLDGFRPR